MYIYSSSYHPLATCSISNGNMKIANPMFLLFQDGHYSIVHTPSVG